ncbi:MAG: DUF2085 domain-containing protein, partial [Candidatus Promineifilaceae bacterium]
MDMIQPESVRPIGAEVRSARRFSAAAIHRLARWLGRHWLLLLNLAWGLFVAVPWLAPLLMEAGWAGAARAVYLFYGLQCHQLPQRSFFLFGDELMYSLAEIQAAWRPTNNPAILRQFIGNPEMGWKVAWSDRMVSMYGSMFLFGLLFWPLRRRLKPLPLWAFGLLLLPMAVDGMAHLISDYTAGIGQGFRDSNAWLAALTNNALPPTFYAGDALGSFNSWLR